MSRSLKKNNTKEVILLMVFVFVLLFALILVDIALDPHDIPIL